MKYNRELRSNLTNQQPIGFQQSCKKHVLEKGYSFQYMVLGKLDIHMQKNEIKFLFTTYKNKLKMDIILKCNTGSYEIVESK